MRDRPAAEPAEQNLRGQATASLVPRRSRGGAPGYEAIGYSR